MLAVFASKNKEVVQIRIQVLVWRQCLHGRSLPVHSNREKYGTEVLLGTTSGRRASICR